MGLSESYDKKPPSYFQKTQAEIVGLISGNGHRILELGCAEGHTGALLKTLGKAIEVHGIELVPEIAERARARLDSVITGNLEVLTFPFEPGYFDYIIATEVLEHLIDPWGLLRRLGPFLKLGGYVIASSPNIRHARVLWFLAVSGDWHYVRYGPLDQTHLRFFTKRSFARMFHEAGYSVEIIRPLFSRRAEKTMRLTFGVFEEFLAVRYLCRARVATQNGTLKLKTFKC